jgi:hypothetical protein
LAALNAVIAIARENAGAVAGTNPADGGEMIHVSEKL